MGCALDREPSVRKLSTQCRILVCERLDHNPEYPVRVYERALNCIYRNRTAVLADFGT